MKKITLKIKLSILLFLSFTIVNAQNHYIIADSDVNNQNYLTTVLQPENDVKTIHLHLEDNMVTKKHPLETTGKILTFVGIPLAIIGGLLISQADELYYTCSSGSSSSSNSYSNQNQNQTNGCQGDPKGGFGILALAAGVGLSATGIVLWTIGRKK